MKKELKCPMCYKEVYSGFGKGCKMCGMILEDESREFCSKKCRSRYLGINSNRMKTRIFVLLFFVFIGLIGFVSTHEGDDTYSHHGMMGWMMGDWGFGFMGFFGWLIPPLIVVALVLFIVWLVKQLQETGGRKK